MTSPPPAPEPSQTQQHARKRSLGGRLAVWAFRLLVLSTVCLAIVTQSGVLRWLILPRIESALGCHAEAGHVSILPSGEIVIKNFHLSVPSIPGTAGRFLEVKRLEVVPRWSGLFTGTIPIDTIRAQEPIIRLSQDRDFNLNIMALSAGAGSKPLNFIPAIDLRHALLDFGEHDASGYTPLISIQVAGRLSRSSASSSRYSIDLRETSAAIGGAAPAPKPDALRVSGEFDLALRQGAITLDNIDLARWQRVAVPSRISDYWGRMAISGEVRNATFSFAPKAGPVVSFSLKDVSLQVPLPAQAEDPPRGADAPSGYRIVQSLLSMRHVSGDLEFRRDGLSALLRGLVEDLPCLVKLETQGYSIDSPLLCTIRAERFTVERQPRLLPFAPHYVRRNFARFSGPTAVVDGEVNLRRRLGDDGQPGPLEIDGRFDFEQGAATFEKFMYPFHAMKGTIRFNDREVRIEGITGLGPTGAKMLATGRIAPPNDQGEVEVDVTVVDAPVDQVLRAAVPPHRRDLLDHLFSEADHTRLIAESLLSDPAAPSGAAGLPFTLGGVCNIRVRVHRDAGDASDYRTTINVAMDRAGLLSSKAPYPLIARDLSLTITDDDVVLRIPRLAGLKGGRFTLAADIILAEGDDPDDYDVRITGVNVPLDPLLIRAIPDRVQEGDSDPLPMDSPRSFVRALGLRGVADGEGRFNSRPDGTNAYFIHAAFAGITSSIGGGGCLEINSIAGDVVLTDEDAHAMMLTGVLAGGRFIANLQADRAPERGAAVSATVEFDEFPLNEPVEELVSIIDRTQGGRLASLRNEYRPDGTISGSLLLSPAAAGTDFAIDFTAIEHVSFDLVGGRLSLEDVAGLVTVDAQRIRASGFTCDLLFDAQPAGQLICDGSWPIAGSSLPAAGAMSIALKDADFGSALVRAAARSFGPALARWLEELHLRGGFSIDALARHDGRAAAFEGTLEPTSVSLTRNGTELKIDRVSGSIRFGAGGGRASGLRAESDRWSFTADGTWTTAPTVDVDLTLGFESDGLPIELLAMLPPEAGKSLTNAGLNVTGPIVIRDARLRSTEDAASLRLTGVADCGPASFNPGLPVTIESASADIDVLWPVDQPSPPRVSAVLDVPRLTLSGITLTDGRAVISAGEQPDTYNLPEISANLHGGTIFASAVLGTPKNAAPAPAGAPYSAELRLAGVDFASLLNELRVNADPSAAPSLDAPASRGTIDATVSLAGTLGQTASRRGRGVARISGGEVIALPGAVPMLRLSNLQPPMGEPLDSATAAFFLQGDLVTFERLEASSTSLVIAGEGSLLLPNGELDFRFNSRGRGTIPIFDDILRGLRNEIVTTVVTGTIRDPSYRLEAFPSTQRMLGSIFRGSPRASEGSAEPDQEKQ